MVGARDSGTATEFMQDPAGRLAGRVQITTDRLKVYLSAVLDAFGSEVDFAQLVKIYARFPGRNPVLACRVHRVPSATRRGGHLWPPRSSVG